MSLLEINNIYNMDCIEGLKRVENIDLTITSPPYNLGIEYDSYNDQLPLDDYIETMTNIFTNLYKVTKDGGRVCVVIPTDIGKLSLENKIPLDVVFSNILENCGFKFRAKIIWNKNQITSRTAWGSFKSPSNPNILSSFEYVLCYYKAKSKKEGLPKNITIEKEEFIQWTNGIWNISPASKKKLNHPAPFPEELCRRLIQMFSYKDDLVCDLFSGSGTTCCVAKKENRKYIGFELSENYTKESILRINKIKEKEDIENVEN